MTDPAVNERAFRSTVGRFLTGVTIVATVDSGGRPWGMTANSFTSVSLKPPLVSVCIARGSGSFDAFSSCNAFGISILAESQRHIAIRFAQPLAYKFAGLEVDEPIPGALTLSDSAAVLACRTVQRVEAGDHTILIGEVIVCGDQDRPPLGYHRGQLLGVGGSAETDAGQVSGRRILVGWLIADCGRVLLCPHGDRWTLPHGALQPGDTMAEALDATAHAVLGGAIDLHFLYSTIDVNQRDTCYIYRGTARKPLPDSERFAWFPIDDLPLDRIDHPSVAIVLQRYARESLTDQFGIFLNVGQGRIARIEREAAWPLGRWDFEQQNGE